MTTMARSTGPIVSRRAGTASQNAGRGMSEVKAIVQDRRDVSVDAPSMQYVILLIAALLTEQICVPSDAGKSIEGALARVSEIRMMESRKTYTLPVSGVAVTGPKEEFLRRRTAPEVLESGLSSGCGDYAIAFTHVLEKCGFRALLIDGAEISVQSLRSRFSGHAVVAVRDDRNGRWIRSEEHTS